jgi:large subunit ribosomal protein L13
MLRIPVKSRSESRVAGVDDPARAEAMEWVFTNRHDRLDTHGGAAILPRSLQRDCARGPFSSRTSAVNEGSPMPRQTYFAKSGDVTAGWYHVDATDKVLGRLATEVATVLMGKHRPEYTPHVDCGEYVVVTNAEKIVLTGRKAEQKSKLRYSGYPGGLKSETYASLLQRRPEVIVEDAVRRMLPKTRLGRQMYSKLKVYAGPDHPHQAQQPQALSV